MLGTIVALLAVALLIVIVLLVRKNNAHKEVLAEKQSFKAEKVQDNVIKAENKPSTDEEIAAFLALHLYLNDDIHDLESNVITIERIQRRYSPWSSKIYSMNNLRR
ncbi:MAG: hypothetical protein H6Q18_533 [Bacteroidetes bacterium]|nr:hypothetical protein [Bacteroidota bacterium]